MAYGPATIALASVCVGTAWAGCSAFAPDVGSARGTGAEGGVGPGGDADTGAGAAEAEEDAAESGAKADGAKAGADAQPDSAKPGPTTWTVNVAPNGSHAFAPAALTIGVGDTVHWVWRDSGHTVTSGTGVADNLFCSPNDKNCASETASSAGATYDHTFAAAGTFPYSCLIHSFTGSITVR